MKVLAVLVLAACSLGAAARADETQTQRPPPILAKPYQQPTQRQIDQLPQSERSRLGVDVSPRAGDEVDQLYRQLMQETDPGARAPSR